MRKATTVLLTVTAAAALTTSTLTTTEAPATAAPPRQDTGPATKRRPDDLPHKQENKRREMRRTAIEKVVRGDARTLRKGNSEVVKLADGQYAEVSMEKTDRLFTILTEFGDKIDPRTGGEPGPLHNQIAKPNRETDNTTHWRADFDRQHFEELFFAQDQESMANFYSEQSQGRYTLTGEVSAWVELPYNEARYGSNEIPASDGYWNYIKDTAQAWFEAQLAAGRTRTQIQAQLATFDKWDRYDYDADGNFDEPDGYIDHFQAVHAGAGEEAGGGAQGPDAIWSHRWFAFPGSGKGPDYNPNGGVPIGDTGFWIGDYTTEPENGGLGVFTHEYGHDLGLPDEYDTSGAGDNGTGFWTLMSSGSWLGNGEHDIGTSPGYMNAWDKLQLGWLDYRTVSPDATTELTLGPAARTTGNPQAVIVPLPKEKVVTEYNTPYSGSYEWWGGSANDLNTQLRRPIDLTGASSGAAITAKAWYDTEAGYDRLRAEVSTDGGTTWERIGEPIDGQSGGWVDLTYDLSAYAGQQIWFRYRYTTDGGIHGAGPMLDDIRITADGTVIFSDDVEQTGRGWSGNWTRFTGTSTEWLGRYYLGENRQYTGYDKALRTGPYNFNRSISKPDWVEHYSYQNGLLVHQWDETQSNNNTNVHPGEGLILPVDARPEPIGFDRSGIQANGRAQSFDATFGLDPTEPLSLSKELKRGQRVRVLSAHLPAGEPMPVFDDSDPKRYWSPEAPQYSVKVAGYGVRIEVLEQSDDGQRMQVRVGPSPEKR